jgi:hypothetical protein
MNVYIRSSSKDRAKFLEISINFFKKYLNLDKSKYNLYVFSKQGLRKNDGNLGQVCKYENNLIMLLDNQLSYPKLLQTISHEMVHIKQYAKGQIKTKHTKFGNFSHFWLGKKVNRMYHKRPWEIEAYSRELELIEAFMKYFSKNKSKLLT